MSPLIDVRGEGGGLAADMGAPILAVLGSLQRMGSGSEALLLVLLVLFGFGELALGEYARVSSFERYVSRPTIPIPVSREASFDSQPHVSTSVPALDSSVPDLGELIARNFGLAETAVRGPRGLGVRHYSRWDCYVAGLGRAHRLLARKLVRKHTSLRSCKEDERMSLRCQCSLPRRRSWLL
ncbi:hypothetical protein AMTR_s00031p00180600 [Amborella trichopoda]|uniref:Uncharacterized protein n=1 Tax=Amborella trichopoda TaxID=13333 RepID=U5D2D2_AMBTC|nr:hypothetical protein AMTR_s00031p00180600 [Amborella trichopoda]